MKRLLITDPYAVTVEIDPSGPLAGLSDADQLGAVRAILATMDFGK